MTRELETTLQRVVKALHAGLGENLHSCCVYGSSVRGNAVVGVSDINLLIVLNESTPAAHQEVAGVLQNFSDVDPFVLARRGFERSARAFATKFASIRRNYRVLHGADALSDIRFDAGIERFLCEQAARNLRLRLVYSFVTHSRLKAYDLFLRRNVTALFVQFSEALRLEQVAMPADFKARIPVFEREFGFDGAVLRELLELKQLPRAGLSEQEVVRWHARLFPVVDAVLGWMESHWVV